MDLGAAFRYPFADPGWLRKCAMAGWPILIPLVGIIPVLGWKRRVFEAVLRGEAELPEASLGEDFRLGVDPFITLLNPVPVLFVLAMVLFVPAGILSAVLGSIDGGNSPLALVGALFMMLASLVWVVVIFGVNIIMPELQRRGLGGERFPLMSPRASLGAVKANPKGYAFAFLGDFASGILGGLGIYACCVGFFVSFPLAHAISAHLLAQWQVSVDGAAQ